MIWLVDISPPKRFSRAVSLTYKSLLEKNCFSKDFISNCFRIFIRGRNENPSDSEWEGRIRFQRHISAVELVLVIN